MKSWLVSTSLFVLALILVACSASSSADMIEPGDKLGDFTITTGVDGNFTYGFAVPCSEPSQGNTYTCTPTVGEKINVSTGLRGTSGTGNLDSVWKNSSYQMFIDDQPVDLAAFGTIDYNHPTAGTIRFANVVLTTDKPGSITVRDSGVFENGDPFSSTSTYVFSQP